MYFLLQSFSNPIIISEGKMRKFLLLFVVLIMIASCICGCTDSGELVIDGKTYVQTDEITDFVCITMEDGEKIMIKLRPDCAPISVENFQKLVSQHFYDGIIFHRVIYNFMIQGGDPNGIGTGGSGEKIYGEFAANGFDNKLSHVRGTVSMARPSNDYDGASSQFFICHGDFSLGGDGQYAAFGTVIYGMETVDKIASVEVSPINDNPIVDQVMKSVRFYKQK